MALEVVSENYEIFLILVGIIGFWMGFDRIKEGDESESKNLQFAGFLGGLALTAVIVLAILNEELISKYTIVFSSLFGLSLIAKPFRKLPIAFAISAIVGLGLMYYVLDQKNKDVGEQNFIAGLSTKFLVIIILIIVIVIFIIGLIQEATMDIMLKFLSIGLIVLVLSVLVFLQGVTLLLETPNSNGLFSKFPGGAPEGS